jgi:hypothetical protein
MIPRMLLHSLKGEIWHVHTIWVNYLFPRAAMTIRVQFRMETWAAASGDQFYNTSDTMIGVRASPSLLDARVLLALRTLARWQITLCP